MEALKAKAILAMLAQPTLQLAGDSLVSAIRLGNAKVTFTGCNDKQILVFKALVGKDWKDSFITSPKGEKGNSPVIAKTLSPKCAEVFAKMEALEVEYKIEAKKSDKYSATGFGGMVLYIRAK